MSSVKNSVGTPLADVDAIDEDTRRRLAALSVTTAEELLGLMEADPSHTAEFLGVNDITPLAAKVGRVASASSTPSLDEAPEETFRTGAAAPAGVSDAPVAMEDVERRLGEGQMRAAGPPGEGADLRDCFGPVRHQGERGTCVAHAVCALAECLEHSGFDLSEQHLYWNSKEHDGDPGEGGTFIRVAMERMIADGACTEATWPYQSQPIDGNEGQGPPPPAAAGDAEGHRLDESDEAGSSEQIRGALDAERPVALSVPVYPNWKGNPMLKLSGFIPMPLPNSIHDGGHAMCAVGYGYDDEFTGGGYFVLRNSWGEEFAPRSPVAPGHALLPFSYWDDYGWESAVATR